jgi:hypothetical protein
MYRDRSPFWVLFFFGVAKLNEVFEHWCVKLSQLEEDTLSLGTKSPDEN